MLQTTKVEKDSILERAQFLLLKQSFFLVRKTASEMHVASRIFSSTSIHFHPFSSIFHFHPQLFTFTYFHPLSPTFMKLRIVFELFSIEMGVHCTIVGIQLQNHFINHHHLHHHHINRRKDKCGATTGVRESLHKIKIKIDDKWCCSSCCRWRIVSTFPLCTPLLFSLSQ